MDRQMVMAIKPVPTHAYDQTAAMQLIKKHFYSPVGSEDAKSQNAKCQVTFKIIPLQDSAITF